MSVPALRSDSATLRFCNYPPLVVVLTDTNLSHMPPKPDPKEHAMLTQREFEQIKQSVKDRKALIEEVLSILATMESSLGDEEKALEAYELAQTDLKGSEAIKTFARLLLGEDSREPHEVRVRTKPNVEYFEEAIISYGKPMHATDIAREAQSNGAIFHGKVAIARQARNSLVNSKRFQNEGGNKWWVIDRPVPDESLSSNGHQPLMAEAV